MKLELDEIYHVIARKTGLSKSRIELVFRSMFEMIADTMREEKGNNIAVPKVGKFVVPLKKLRYVNNERYLEELSRYNRRMEQFSAKKARRRREGSDQTDDMQGV